MIFKAIQTSKLFVKDEGEETVETVEMDTIEDLKSYADRLGEHEVLIIFG